KLEETLGSIDIGPLLAETSQSKIQNPKSKIESGGPVLMSTRMRIGGVESIGHSVAEQLREDCSNTITEGGLINAGVDAELDRLRSIESGGKEWIAKFE